MVHPRAHRWRARVRSPFRVLVPAWIVMWIGLEASLALGGTWRSIPRIGSGFRVGSCSRWGSGFIRGQERISAGRNWEVCLKSSRASRAEPGHVGNSLACAASCVPGPSVRDACLEHWNRAAGLLAADRVCDRDGRSDDSNGRCRVRKEIRRGIHAISSTGRSRTSKDIREAAIGIIRLGRGLMSESDACS